MPNDANTPAKAMRRRHRTCASDSDWDPPSCPLPLMHGFHHGAAGNCITHTLHADSPLLECEVQLRHGAVPSRTDDGVNPADGAIPACLDDVHGGPIDRRDGREWVSCHAGFVYSRNREVSAERAELGPDVRQRGDEVDVVSLLRQL